MPSTIGKCKLFRIKHITLLEGEVFLRSKHKISFFEIKRTFFGRKENTINKKHINHQVWSKLLFFFRNFYKLLIDHSQSKSKASKWTNFNCFIYGHIKNRHYWNLITVFISFIYLIRCFIEAPQLKNFLETKKKKKKLKLIN